MKISIEVFGMGAFTKYGKLKKKAPHEVGCMMVDVEPYTAGSVDTFIEETATMLKREYQSFKSPYFFTHIEAVSKVTGEPVRIFETCNDLVTSPVKLLERLVA